MIAAELQTPTTTAVAPYDQVQQQLLEQGVKLIGDKQYAEAIRCCIDPIISFYDGRLEIDKRTYSARSPQETLFYMFEAAYSKVNAITLSSTYGYAYFTKSYALTELNQYEAAQNALQRALELSPQNAQFLSERGNQLARARAWNESLEIYRKAEEAAKSTSPENTRTIDLGRALRGQGFVLVELNQIDQAEKVYLECIRIDPNDRKAAAELNYVRSLVSKGRQ
jgi:tetratricopeptide (TPR) repeat protein